MRSSFVTMLALAAACSGPGGTGGTGGGGGAGGGPGGGAGGAGGAGGGGASKRVFITSMRFNGNLGGVSGADVKCNTAATDAGIGGTWKAWVSTSSSNALDRIAEVGPWRLIRAFSQPYVFSGKSNLSGAPTRQIDITELNTVTGSGAWTGTRDGGTAGFDCVGWTSSVDTDRGWVGDSNAFDTKWTDWGSDTCDGVHGLYCFEQ